MDLGSLTGNELKELAEKALKMVSEACCKQDNKNPVRIVVLQRGWVAVGYFSQKGDECLLESPAIIRNWGTTKGLPQLVGGPVKEKTILDKSSAPLRFHRLTAVLMLDCDSKKWHEHL